MSTEFTLVLDWHCALGESPVWCTDAELLVFSPNTAKATRLGGRYAATDSLPWSACLALLGFAKPCQ